MSNFTGDGSRPAAAASRSPALGVGTVSSGAAPWAACVGARLGNCNFWPQHERTHYARLCLMCVCMACVHSVFAQHVTAPVLHVSCASGGLNGASAAPVPHVPHDHNSFFAASMSDVHLATAAMARSIFIAVTQMIV